MEIICKIEHISKKFDDKVVFQDFCLTIQRGDLLCISGVSGSGKSTLLNMIGMFDQPDKGTIELFGKRVEKLNKKEKRNLLRNKLFYLFQNYALVDDKSVDYNLKIPLIGQKLSKESKIQLKKEALERVNLDIALNKKIYQLSGGEQQRVALARGFLHNCELILADEPTGSLDSENRKAVMQILKLFHQEGKTVVIVSHDQYVLEQCEKVVYL